jgi:hypothetical protein
MSFPRSHRRVAAVVCAAGIAAFAGTPAAWASSRGAQSSTTPDGLLGTTTTSTSTTSTTKPPSTTTSTTSTTVPPKSKGGVPNVPVGGPPTTKPPPNTPPPPPPDPGPILTAVDSDLSQLAAIKDYPEAVTAVADGQQSVTLAAAGVQSALAAHAQAQAAQKVAQSHVGSAQERVKNLAIAAYMGLGYATPAGQAAAGDGGTVSTPGGLTGTDLADADEMLTLVAQHDRANLADTHRLLKQAEKATQAAGTVVAQARANLVSAQAALQGRQQALALLTKAATTPGAAANVIGTTSAADGSGLSGSGLAALGAPSTTLAAQTSAATSVPNPTSPSILGPPTLTGAEMAAWFASTSKKPNITVPMAQLAQDYQQSGQATAVRDDVAFAQSVVETGFFSFPSYGQLTAKDNNFAGIGACDSCAHGWSFKDAATGVSAQMELLEAYASTKAVPTPLVGNVGIGGCCQTWMALAGKWASSLTYGIEVMTIYHQMLSWVIPQRLVSAGLLAPPPAQAKGPTLAQLPDSKPATTTTTKPPAKH